MTLVVGLSGRGYQVIPRLKFQVEALPSDAASFNSGLYGGSEDSAPYESLLRLGQAKTVGYKENGKHEARCLERLASKASLWW